MKKYILICLGLAIANAGASDRFGIRLLKEDNGASLSAGIRLGSACGFGTESMGYKTEYDNGLQINSQKQIYGSHGKGILGGAFVDYNVNDHWGLGLSYNHLFGSEFTYASSSHPNGNHDEYTHRGSYSNLMLEFMFETCCEGPFNGHARFGPAFMLASGNRVEYTEIQNNQTQLHWIENYKNRFGLGFSGSVGADYHVNDRFSLGLDIGSLIYSGRQKSAELTTYQFQGADQLANMKTSQKEIEFVDEWNQSVNSPGNMSYNMDKPLNVLAGKTSYSSLTWSLSGRFRF